MLDLVLFVHYAMPDTISVYYFSGGVPRLVNTLCDYALVHGYALVKDTIDIAIAIEVMKGRKIGGFNRFVKDSEQIETVRQGVIEDDNIDLAKFVAV